MQPYDAHRAATVLLSLDEVVANFNAVSTYPNSALDAPNNLEQFASNRAHAVEIFAAAGNPAGLTDDAVMALSIAILDGGAK